jgi:fused signal recognition particle receptor
MFGKLKGKLKGWFKKSSEKVEETAKKEEIVETSKPIIEKKEKKKKSEKKIKKEKPEKKEAIKPKPTETEEEIKPGVVESLKETDPIEVVSKQPKKEMLETLEEDKTETHEDVSRDIKEAKKEEIKEEDIEKLEEKIEKAKQEPTKEVPVKYNVAKHKYEPDVEEIKEKEEPIEEINEEVIKEPEKKKGFFSRIKKSFSYKISESEFDEIFDDLEMLLLENNVALEVVEDLREKLSEQLIEKEIKKENLQKEISNSLKKALEELIIEPDNPLEIIKMHKETNKEPFVILFFGINGTGKTTSIAKFTNLLQQNNLSVVLAAGDTFRAASIEQIQEHADKLKVPLIKQDYGTDPSAVGFDAIKYAKNHKIDVVLIDTAGRMHTKSNLLQEMEKICRVTNPNLKIFVAESIAGNDATEQAKTFHDMIGVDGSILSKADIDEKGGTILSVSHVTHKPIFYLGTGQEYKDLQLFNKQEFIESLGL